jgi:hypothetical protein
MSIEPPMSDGVEMASICLSEPGTGGLTLSLRGQVTVRIAGGIPAAGDRNAVRCPRAGNRGEKGRAHAEYCQ